LSFTHDGDTDDFDPERPVRPHRGAAIAQIIGEKET
jgi:hypothetical protein